MLRIVRTDSSNKDFQELVALLDAGLKIIDGDDAPFFAQFNKIDNINHVVVVYSEGKAVGCGAIKEYEPGTIEIKRMFVREENRGQGVAVALLGELELWASELGFKTAILETGIKMKPAVQLYQKCGYQKMPNYGQYENVAASVCMKKDLR